MKTKKGQLFTAVILCLICSTATNAQQTLLEEWNAAKSATAISRDVTITKIDNDMANFSVLVNVDKENYTEDESLVATGKASRDGWLYLIHISSTGKETLLIPNEYQSDNRIKANQTFQYPPKDNASYRFRISPPNFGRETIKAIVTDRPLKAIDLKKYAKSPATPLDVQDSKSVLDELVKSKDVVVEKKPETPATSPAPRPEVKLQFATHQVTFMTHPMNETPVTSAKPERIVICFGVQKFRDPKITPLSVCANDAKSFANLMMTIGGVSKDNCVVLLNEEVTLENVKKIFCDILPKMTSRGSEIVIFWSGHGGRLSSTHADSSSTAYTSYLVPFDGDTNNPENTMLLEGPFGQWVQRLNGRKLFFVLDACYSGALPENAKGIEDSTQTLADAVKQMTNGAKSIGGSNAANDEFTFCFQNFARSKSLGQKDLAILVSSTRDQLSWERQEGDLSVMTYFLVKAVEEGPRYMTHKDIKPIIRQKVQEYVEKYHPNTYQTVVEQDDLTPGMILKP